MDGSRLDRLINLGDYGPVAARCTFCADAAKPASGHRQQVRTPREAKGTGHSHRRGAPDAKSGNPRKTRTFSWYRCNKRRRAPEMDTTGLRIPSRFRKKEILTYHI